MPAPNLSPVTDDELSAARIDLDAARVELETARTGFRVPGPINEHARNTLSDALSRERIADMRLADLVERHQRQSAALAERDTAESAVRGQLDTLATELDASRTKLARAVTAAESAMVTAVQAADAHRELVRTHRDTVKELGLVAGQRPDGIDHATGASASGVRLRGTWWAMINPADVIARSIARVASSALPRNALLGRLTGATGAVMHTPDWRVAPLLTDVPDLPVRAEVRRERISHTATMVSVTRGAKYAERPYLEQVGDPISKPPTPATARRGRR